MSTKIEIQATHLHNELLASGVEIFNEKNRRRMQTLFSVLPNNELTYGATITYLLQQIHGHHFPNVTDPRGYCFSQDSGKTICPFAIAPRPSDGTLSLVIISPRGARVAENVIALAYIVREIDNSCNVYIKNPPSYLAAQLQTISKTAITSWNDQARYEDDTYSNVIVNVVDLTDNIEFTPTGLRTYAGKPYLDVKQKLRGLERKLQEDGQTLSDFTMVPYNPAHDWQDAQNIVQRFFREKEVRGHLSKPVDYYNIFSTPVDWRNEAQHCIRAFICFKERKLGLVAAERIGHSTTFGVYSLLINTPPANLLRPGLNISELQVMALMHAINNLSGTHADFGGAETESLQRYHAKFLPERRIKPELQPVQIAPWLQLAP